jgi:hypothetical protein
MMPALVADISKEEKTNMKRFIVEQNGFVQVEASRRFIIEVPDHISEGKAQELVEGDQVLLPDDEGMEWWDMPDRKWSGYDVEIEETDVYDPETLLVAPSTDGLRVIRVEAEGTSLSAMASPISN